jgi:uncharacterized membrane protein YeiB
MALTNYLLQTFFGLLLFYEFGLGLFDKKYPAINVLLGGDSVLPAAQIQPMVAAAL